MNANSVAKDNNKMIVDVNEDSKTQEKEQQSIVLIACRDVVDKKLKENPQLTVEKKQEIKNKYACFPFEKTVFKSVCAQSQLISNSINGVIDKDQNLQLPLPDINQWELKYLVEFMEHHAVHPIHIHQQVVLFDTDLIRCGASEWDVAFMKQFSFEELKDILMASHTIGLQSLALLSGACIAMRLSGKTTEQMREELGIRCDFSKEEEEALILDSGILKELYS